ncbi:MAG: CNNM domain-containing protein [Planctomycetaceae bacterium]|jgi:CBS domain containing-hemolysin-like protein|nr:CNNM domain-containing protein [Planctomycetaceae bacterium]
MATALILLVLGFVHSAVFSGTETGYYRVSRIRILVDAVSGKRAAKMILWLINRPSVFIATILIGNNIANNIVSTGGILLVQTFFVTGNHTGDIMATVLLTPFLFVLGEMFPKYLALHAPYQFLRRVCPLFLLYVILFLPASMLIGFFNRMLSSLLHGKHEEWRMILARKELSRGFDEGEYAGVLFSVQRELTKNVFAAARQSIRPFARPLDAFPRLTQSMPPETLLAEAKKHGLCEFPVFSENPLDEPVGYLRTFELQLAAVRAKDKPVPLPIRSLESFEESHSPLNALLLFQSTGESLACLESEDGEITGLISVSELRKTMFSTESFPPPTNARALDP